MNIKMKRYLAVMLAVLLLMTTVLAENLLDIAAGSSQLAIKESAGYEEGAYAEWEAVAGADGYRAYVSSDGTNYTPIDDMLIREYSDYWRVDTVGLKAGTYSIKIEAVKVNNDNTTSVLAESVAKNLNVVNYDRSGFAFSSKSPLKTGSGAYNDDGTLKSGAQVVYVTPQTAKTCKAKVNGAVVTGFQAILDAKQSEGTSGDIIDFRIIGCVKKDDLDKISSSKEGLQVKGKNAYTAMNITIEGIGEDACIDGFGMLLRNCGNVELRNFGVINFMDDGISLDTDNCNIWVHDLDIFYGNAGGDSDQAKGDGSVDIKAKSTYITVSYVHFWDSGKCSLCGMNDTEEFMVTYHHNWFDHSDSRHARIRVATVHMYNNYFDGNAKYGVGVTNGSSAFVENNYFRNCKYPLMSSKQGTDKDVVEAGTGSGIFSKENGGIIKAYNNKIEGAEALTYANSADGTTAANTTSFDAYLASSRNEQVPASYKTLQGGTTYNNFDTSSSYDLGVKEAAIDSPEAAKANVMSKAGRLSGGDLKFTFTASDDTSYDINSSLKAAVTGYQSTVKAIGGLDKTGTTPPETEPESGSQQGSESGSQQGSEVTPSGGSKVLNITKDGITSDYFSFPGTKKNLSKDKGTVQYNGLTLTQCLKMEGGTQIQFTNSSDAKLVLVFGTDVEATKKVKIDGKKYEVGDSRIVTVDVAAGTHLIEKNDSMNLFYIEVIEKGAEKPSESENETKPGESESETKPSESESGSESESESSGGVTEGAKQGIVTNLSKLKDADFQNPVYVSPTGTADGVGTIESPKDLESAIKSAKAGDAITLLDGTYKFDHQVTISEDNNGTEDCFKILKAADNAVVKLDFSSQPYNSSDTSQNARGLQINGSYWYVYGITVYGAADNGIYITGKNNIVERCILQANRDTGLQIGRRLSSLSDMKDWPSDNVIINCTSFDNCDPATGENADGFAAKLTCGNGNVFDGCIAYSNCDDGWDLYAKEATGSIGVVTIRNCVAFNNGTLTDGSSQANGDMNGFKLGGSNGKVPTPHIVENCVAFNNGKHGFTDNGNGAAISLTNCTSYNNAKSNFAFDRTTGGKFNNLVSYAKGSTADKFVGTITNSIYFTSGKKHSYTGTTSVAINKSDKIGNAYNMSDSSFKNLTAPSGRLLTIDNDCRNADGTVNLKHFLEMADANSGMGATFGNGAVDTINVKAAVISKPDESESETGSTSSEEESGSAGETDASLSGNEGGSSSNGGAETGDGNTALLWMFIALLSGVCAVYVEKKTRKAN